MERLLVSSLSFNQKHYTKSSASSDMLNFQKESSVYQATLKSSFTASMAGRLFSSEE
jgi:hypothetical protein